MRYAAIMLLCLVFVTLQVGAVVSIDSQVSGDTTTAATTIASPAISTAGGNELVLALIATDALSSKMTVSGVTGGGLTWALVERTNTQSGTSEIWRALAVSPLSNAIITATLAQKVQASIAIVSFSGVDTTGSNGSGAIGAIGSANAKSGAPSSSLTTTRDGSWVIGVGNDYDNAIGRTVGSNQTLIHQYLSSSGDTYWMQRQNAPTTSAGTAVPINDTAPTGDRFNLSICEVLAPAVIGPDTTPPSVSVTSPANNSVVTGTVNLSANATDNVAVAKVQFAVDGTLYGAAITTPPYSIQWDTTTTTQAVHSVTAIASDTSNNQTTSNPVMVTVDETPPKVSITSPIDGSSVTGTVSISANATDNNSVAGVQFFVDGTAVGSEVTVQPYLFSWNSAVVANGSHSIAAKAIDAAGLTTTSIAINVTTSNIVSNSPAIDKVISVDKGSAGTSVSTAAFSTGAPNEILLAFIASDSSNKSMTVSGVIGGGLTWTLTGRTDAQMGTAEVWRAYSAGQLSNVTVTATFSQSAPACSMTVVSFTGADTSGLNGFGAIGAVASANSASGVPSVNITTSRANSWIFGVGNDYTSASARTLGSGQTMVHQDLSPTGDTYWVQRTTAPTPSQGTVVTLNDTAPTGHMFNFTAVEVLASGVSGPPTPPTISLISPATTSTIAGRSVLTAVATDTYAPIAGVQFQLDGVNLGAEVNVTPYSVTWDTTTASTGVHVITATARDAAGGTATSDPVSVTVDNSGNPTVVGSWSSAVSLPTVAVNLILLDNNKILFYEDGSSPTIWDYTNSTFSNISTNENLFCSGHAVLSDGRVLIVGGYGGSGTSIGISNAEMFDPSVNSWTKLPNMSYKRWYPTATTLSDGRVLVTAGWQTTEHTNAGIPEIYDPATNTWTKLTNANNPFETYPFIYLLPNGTLVHVGGSEYATVTETLNLSTQTWTTVDGRIIDGGSSAMYLPNKIVKAGSATDSQGSGPSSSTTYVIDMTQNSPAWQQIPSMAYPRSFLNLTVLPDGSVLSTGGETDKNGGNIANAVYAAELWSPISQTWSTMSSMHTPREYHSTALLLPDGRVLQSGMGADFGNVPDEPSAEFFSPPYLFKGARPTITQAPSVIHYGQNFTVNTPDGATITKAVLIRTGAATHFFDQNTHYVPVSFQTTSGGLSLTAPADGNAAPPGYYMLFLVNSAGVPSIAPFVQVLP